MKSVFKNTSDGEIEDFFLHKTMSEIRIGILDDSCAISGDLRRSFGDISAAALTTEPKTIAELAEALRRFAFLKNRTFFTPAVKFY